MPLLFRRLLHAIDNHGLGGLLRRIVARTMRRSGANRGFHEPPTLHPFDRLHGTDTSGHIPGEALGGESAAGFYNTAYYAISPSTLRQALELFPGGELAPYTFVDLGCGKGRALLVAAEFAFADIVGVELAPELVQIARRNTALQHDRIRVVEGDAATVALPHEAPLLIFLYHPFLAPVLRRALGNLTRQRSASAQPTWLLYANCRYGKTLDRFPALERVWEHSFALSPEDAAADRHRITHERYTLFQLG